jgi:hypothetical protein
MENENDVLHFIRKHPSLSSEYIRSTQFFDIETSDKDKNSILCIPGYKISLKKVFSIANLLNIRDKIDLLRMIYKNSEGLSVRSTLGSYPGIKNDWREIVQQNDKIRKILVLKNDFFYDYSVWPFVQSHYFKPHLKVMLTWHTH